MDPSGSPRGMLPACVVKMRSVLCCMAFSPAWAYASFLASECTILRRCPCECSRALRSARSRVRYRRALSRADALPFQRAADLVQDHRIVDGCRHGPGIAVSDLLHGAAQDLARARLRQPR